jgi:two-component system, OmpR family, phosphate regulon sensor histidine kinase PhoR
MPLRLRITLIAIAASAVSLVAMSIAIWPGLRNRTIAQTRDALTAEARLVSQVVAEPLARGVGPEQLDPIVDQAGKELSLRVTIIGRDGRVLADSSLSGAALLAAENHAGRPEVSEALAAGSASQVRHSATVDRDLLYAAVAIRHRGETVGVARVARAMAAVEEQARDLRRGVTVALLLALALALVLSNVLSTAWVRSLKEMMKTARRLAGGDLTARANVRSDDEMGELAGIINQFAVQQQRRLEEIARDRARTDAILGAMAEGVLAVDTRGVVIMASEAFRRDFALSEPVGRHYLEVVRQREIADLLEAVLDGGEPRRTEVEVWPLRRVFAITVVPFPETDGRATGAVATFHDLTERRRLDQIRRDFVANASHELRTPLTSIRGFVEALEDGAMSETATAERFLGKIRTHADRMTALMDDLLELSRLESGHRPPRFETVDIAELVEDIVGSFAASASQKKQKLKADADDAPAIVTDTDRLRRVLECLVENAIKYTPAGGEVRLTVRATDAGLTLDVRDNGPGIPAEHLPRIFERFYRVDKARSRELGGTGLGLSIAKHLAEGMGAALSVTSEVGAGSCFTVAVPARPAVTQPV